MTKEYKQELADLESGLNSMKNRLKDPKLHDRDYKRVLVLIEVQEGRIDFFKRGYRFRNKELKEQKEL